jgi:hypothetical protein
VNEFMVQTAPMMNARSDAREAQARRRVRRPSRDAGGTCCRVERVEKDKPHHLIADRPAEPGMESVPSGREPSCLQRERLVPPLWYPG